MYKELPENFLKGMPSPGELEKLTAEMNMPLWREANGHIHTPYSFSAFKDIDEAFDMASKEGISVLGINDFYVTDGYRAFAHKSLEHNVFPLFNIEFIGLMKDQQKKGVRINDPNNPGRIYFSGKGLDYPFHLDREYLGKLNKVKEETQAQLREMIDKLNLLMAEINPSVRLGFEDIKKRYAHQLVRERHIAKALRIAIEENFSSATEKKAFLEKLYGGKSSKAGFDNPAGLENEIRSNLLKAGGAAFVEEDENSFMDLHEIIRIITDAGGIPCYPVLLDDPEGRCTEFENDTEDLFRELTGLGIGCIELIPGRNDLARLDRFARFFDKLGFVVTFGTEHNTPDLIPLTVSSRGRIPLSDELKHINWRGVCVIAAHQYLRANGRTGYIGTDGRASAGERSAFEKTGRSVIEYFLKNRR